MPDDKSKTGTSDRDRINANEPYELRHWAKKLGVGQDQLRAAVRKVGPMVKDVKKELTK